MDLSFKGTAKLEGYKDKDGNIKPWTEEEKKFLFYDGLPIVRSYSDFKIGLQVPDKLLPKRIRGGIVLQDDYYTMRG